jgi:ribose 5-phosphate isomerase RpiB
MARNQHPLRGSLPELQAHVVTMVGTGAAAPTKVFGNGVTITRTGAGDYRLTWAENPGVYVATVHSLRAATESDNKGHTLVMGSWSTSAWTLDLTLWDSAFAAEDLEANEWIELVVFFKPTSAV